MKGLRKMTAAFAMAAILAAGLGTTLEAKPKPEPDAAICEYLKAVMDYENVNSTIYAWAASLYKKFGCGR